MSYAFALIILIILFLIVFAIVWIITFSSPQVYPQPKPDATCVTSNPLPRINAVYIFSNNNVVGGPYYFRYNDNGFPVTTNRSEATNLTYTSNGYLQVSENSYLKISNGGLKVVCNSPTIWTFTSSGFIVDTSYSNALTLAEASSSDSELYSTGQRYDSTDLIQCGWRIELIEPRI